MNLYRLDIQLPDGTSYPVADMLGPRLIRARQDAARVARSAAGYSGMPVLLTRIQGAGHLRRMGHYYPDGTFKRA